MPLPDPYPKQQTQVHWLKNPFTQGMIDAIRKRRRFARAAVAVVDLSHRTRKSDGRGYMTCSGWNLYDQRYAASLPKIAAMFAAYRLRESLRSAAKAATAATSQALFEEVTKEWQTKVESSIAGARRDFPKLSRIFSVTGSRGAWTVDYTDVFRKHMRSMIGKSSNRSASYCIEAIGFQYLNGALVAEGLYDKNVGGLWLGADFRGRKWKRDPRGRTSHGASAHSIAKFLTLVEDNRLVSPQASKEMRDLMRVAGSWLANGLLNAKPPRPISSYYAKVGFYGACHDCAVIQRSARGKGIRYAVAVLTASSPRVIQDLILPIDDYIVASH